MKCWRWFRFCVPAGQALVIAGYLDLVGTLYLFTQQSREICYLSINCL